ncbi:hypothetical protein L873DRAFT_719277 [Choiromyces venosus 120613-1]|uniref:Uncharacterized protein n=1 Tax=Choiromyces venosus 120613-1 TaxID=1336337 RepID=A0A3N4JUT6_9PEZI|nr:hypothetical protein L873DRAFT_719277 [Choiromyces venosus 120613-1]
MPVAIQALPVLQTGDSLYYVLYDTTTPDLLFLASRPAHKKMQCAMENQPLKTIPTPLIKPKECSSNHGQTFSKLCNRVNDCRLSFLSPFKVSSPPSPVLTRKLTPRPPDCLSAPLDATPTALHYHNLARIRVSDNLTEQRQTQSLIHNLTKHIRFGSQIKNRHKSPFTQKNSRRVGEN